MRERNKVLCSILTIFREFGLHMALLQGIFSYFPASFKKLITQNRKKNFNINPKFGNLSSLFPHIYLIPIDELCLI